MKHDVLSKISTLKDILKIAEDKISKNEISVESADKVNTIVNIYLTELEKELLN